MARAPRERSRTTRIATWCILGVVALLGTEIGLAASQSPVRAPSPAQLLHETFTAAARSDAFHYQAVWRAGDVSQVVEGDARPSSGSESVTVGVERFSVVCTGQEAYFKGDAAALRDQLGLPATTASSVAGKWISLQQFDEPFPSLQSVTTSAALAQVLIAPSFISPPLKKHGLLLSRITGRVPHGRVVTGKARLDLLSRSKLPATYVAQGSNGGQSWSSTISFSRWGANGPIKAPVEALPFSSLQRTTLMAAI